jgi:hypothetical protein
MPLKYKMGIQPFPEAAYGRCSCSIGMIPIKYALKKHLSPAAIRNYHPRTVISLGPIISSPTKTATKAHTNTAPAAASLALPASG